MVRRLLDFLKEDRDDSWLAGMDGWFPSYSEGGTQCASLQASDATNSCATDSHLAQSKTWAIPREDIPIWHFS